MSDDVTKQLAKTDDLRLQVKAETVDGQRRMRVLCSSMEQNLTLKVDEKLEITIDSGSMVLRRVPIYQPFPPHIITAGPVSAPYVEIGAPDGPVGDVK